MVPFSAILIVASVAASQMELVIASSKSPYDSGRDHGCDDAEISDEDDRYISQQGKGESFHTDEFMDGYHAGFDDCSGGDDSDGSGGDTSSSDRGDGGSSQGKKTIEDYCIQYLIIKSDEECHRMVEGNDIKAPGLVYLLCNAIKAVGTSATGGLSTLLSCPIL